MGNHTNFYKLMDNQPSYDTAKNYMVKLLSSEINYALFHNEIPDNDWILLLKRQLRMITNGLCKVAVMRRYSYHHTMSGKCFSDRTHLFYQISHCDVFKVLNSGDITDELLSFDETMLFLDKHKDSIYDCDDGYLEKIKIFWLENPNGLISFS